MLKQVASCSNHYGLKQWSSAWGTHIPGVRGDILGGTRKHLTGYEILKKICMLYIIS
jgi:hypothetical protein